MDKIDNFDKQAKLLFQPTLECLGYKLEEIKYTYANNYKWSSHHIYNNPVIEMMVDIRQEPYYSDYGFSFFLFKLTLPVESNILCNVPHEIQDQEGAFLVKAHNELFSNQDIVNLISGKEWRVLGDIPLQA